VALNDLQNVLGKTLDVQGVFQQAAAQSELALKQTERRLAAERERQNRQIEAGTESAAGQASSLDAAPRLAAERQKRYHIAFRQGQGPVLELEENPDPGQHRLDLQI
jgi:hypothetical protein